MKYFVEGVELLSLEFGGGSGQNVCEGVQGNDPGSNAEIDVDQYGGVVSPSSELTRDADNHLTPNEASLGSIGCPSTYLMTKLIKC
jgi:hypothetical protein